MRAVKSSGTSQKAIAGQNLSILGFATAKVKNIANVANTKLPKKVLVKQSSGEQSDASTETSESILSTSKKIQKLRNLPIPSAKNVKNASNQSGLRMALRSSKIFLEDGTKLSRNYTIIDYQNSQTNEQYRFPCFPDFDLGITTGYSEKLRAHTCDNDCTTDDDQIKSAVKTLYNSLKEAVQEEKENGNSKKKSNKN